MHESQIDQVDDLEVVKMPFDLCLISCYAKEQPVPVPFCDEPLKGWIDVIRCYRRFFEIQIFISHKCLLLTKLRQLTRLARGF
ncbi:hypothetical protein AXG53_09750 [Stenotrophomonas sp. KCTC 12332]|nr:hypothetical protein AXG53_09750 [Stenotrophomonas sp. KCTC 12332]